MLTKHVLKGGGLRQPDKGQWNKSNKNDAILQKKSPVALEWSQNTSESPEGKHIMLIVIVRKALPIW